MIDAVRERVTDAARWVMLTVAGGVLVTSGVVMLFTPGPGWGLIALGLWLWAKQFRWAKRVLDRLADWLHEHRHRLPAFVAHRVDEWRRRRGEALEQARRIALARAAARDGSPAPSEPVAPTDAPRGDGGPGVIVDDLVVVVRPPRGRRAPRSRHEAAPRDSVDDLEEVGSAPAPRLTPGRGASGGA